MIYFLFIARRSCDIEGNRITDVNADGWFPSYPGLLVCGGWLIGWYACVCVFLFYVEGPVFPRFLGSGKPLVPVRDIRQADRTGQFRSACHLAKLNPGC